MQRKHKLITALVAVVFVAVAVKYLESIQDIKFRKTSQNIARSAKLERLLVNGINNKTIKLTVDGMDYFLTSENLYVDDNMNIMINEGIVSKLLSCAVIRYSDSRVILERGNETVEFHAGKEYLEANGTKIKCDIRPVLFDDTLYLPLASICKYLSFDCSWNSKEASVNLSNQRPEEKLYPHAYDYRTVGRFGTIKDQANLGTCWAFASLTALETSALPYMAFDFSEDHLSNQNGFNLSQRDGGEYNMSMAYLAAWKGPVLEAEDPYGDGISPDNLSAAVHVQEMQMIASRDFDAIKKAVFLYGGVQSSIYLSLQNANSKDKQNYSSETFAYCYMGSQKANHDIVIVGWDDSYPAANFATEPAGDGAFICANSWGSEFGDGGFFYVSYYDANIGVHNLVFTKVETTNNYDEIYQSDICGYVGALGYDRSYAYFANVYTARSDETLRAVSFYATTPATSYKIYLCENADADKNFNNKIFLTEGQLGNAGYYTIDLGREQHLFADQKYAIIVYIDSPNATRPVAIECRADVATETAIIDDGEGYISMNGKYWEHVEETQKCNICLKMFTDKVYE